MKITPVKLNSEKEVRSLPRATIVLAAVVVGGAAITPLVVTPGGYDRFNLPQRLVVETEAIVALAVLLTGLLWHGAKFVRPVLQHRTALLWLAAVTIWTTVTTLLSTNRLLSFETLIWVASCTVIAVSTLIAGRVRPLLQLVVPLVPLAVNGLVATLQRTEIYNPFAFERSIGLRERVTGFIGNPNVLATTLVFGGVAALALAFTTVGRVRVFGTVVAVLALTGIVATETLTALGSFAVASAVLVVVRFGRRGAVWAAGATAIVLISILLAPSLRFRATAVAGALAEGRFNVALSQRLTGHTVALEIFRDHVIAGSGPGTFHWWYLPYKLEVDRRHPDFIPVNVNFGEAHNDHLQTLAVAGLPGYLLLLMALWYVARLSWHRPGAGEGEGWTSRWASTAALPLVVAFATAALAQFPLEQAVPSRVLFHLAALSVAWGRTS